RKDVWAGPRTTSGVVGEWRRATVGTRAELIFRRASQQASYRIEKSSARGFCRMIRLFYRISALVASLRGTLTRCIVGSTRGSGPRESRAGGRTAMSITRRRFVQSTLASGAVLASGGPAVHGQDKGSKRYRTALIGSGWWGTNILREAIRSE